MSPRDEEVQTGTTLTEPAHPPASAAPFALGRLIERYDLPLPSAELEPSVALLRKVARVFGEIPVENATDLCTGRSGRCTETLIVDHLLHGSGGTPFLLASALAEVLELYRFDVTRHLGSAEGDEGEPSSFNHAALIVEIGDRMFFCDPGMPIKKPIAVPEDEHMHLYTGARESELLIERSRAGHLAFMLRTASGFSRTHSIDLLPVSRAEMESAHARWRHGLGSRRRLRVDRLIDGRRWMLRDDRLSCRSTDGEETACHATWDGIGRRFGVQTSILKRAFALTPGAHVTRRVWRVLTEAAWRPAA
jgi:arylamine N-acetyltransferase